MDYFVHPTAVIDEGATIGPGSSVWHFCHLMPGCVIGSNCSLGQNVFVAGGVKLGDGCKVQNNVSLYEGVVCGKGVFIGPSAVFTNVLNPRSGVNRRGQYTTTVLGDGATIGANAVIVCGHDIGAFAFIGAGSVVTSDIPAFALFYGNPARHRGWMSRAGHRLNFEHGRATCPETGEAYRMRNGRVEVSANE